MLFDFIYKDLYEQTIDTAAWRDILDTCGGERGSERYVFCNNC